jgi:hypothetical protein
MKRKEKLLNLIIALALFSNCAKDDCDKSTKNLNVDKSYLPYIIPYSDTSTRLFLKNGKDTLLFKSQGLNESIEIYKEDNTGVCRTYYLQKLSLTMAASDSDYFKINYYADRDGTLYNNYEIFNGVNNSKTATYLSNDYVNYFPTVKKILVLNNSYDSIKISINNYKDSVISKPKIGIIKVKITSAIYELIK